MVKVFRRGEILGEDEGNDSSRELEEKFEVFQGLFRALTVIHLSRFWADILWIVKDWCLRMGDGIEESIKGCREFVVFVVVDEGRKVGLDLIVKRRVEVWAWL